MGGLTNPWVGFVTGKFNVTNLRDAICTRTAGGSVEPLREKVRRHVNKSPRGRTRFSVDVETGPGPFHPRMKENGSGWRNFPPTVRRRLKVTRHQADNPLVFLACSAPSEVLFFFFCQFFGLLLKARAHWLFGLANKCTRKGRQRRCHLRLLIGRVLDLKLYETVRDGGQRVNSKR